MASNPDRRTAALAIAATLLSAVAWWFGSSLQPLWWAAWLAPLLALSRAFRRAGPHWPRSRHSAGAAGCDSSTRRSCGQRPEDSSRRSASRMSAEPLRSICSRV